ncbi:MAG: helicase-related protein [Sphingopyxis sp.]|uniref:helicase-related protein n=1 Tax=Sphingopyxis sp. TaxID=1908224 RepID=UPI003D6CD5A9
MSSPASSPVKAVLGPTNTGKTHLAVERLTARSSGMIGFPLRLLAREVYDRVVAIKGEKQVALVTGEERIMPPDARYLLGTMEALPIERDVAFVGIDEAQLGADPERGHVFTDRMLRARGREETMILGSASITGLVRDLVPEAEIITRPRFSTLSYAGTCKLSRLPKRSAVVAFSAEEVYAIAEMLRRFAGGAAVVMGALSPRTRNAQVEMFQAGEVDYLVATDAIGMGLNLDVQHVAFASLQKFDGRRLRRLTISEMAQIAGRAGRHQQDGSFGTVGLPQGGFTPEEIHAIEGHHFPPMQSVYWRNPTPGYATLDQLLSDLAQPPSHPRLRAAPEAVDMAVLKHLAGDMEVRARGGDFDAVARLWGACGLPDFEQLGAEHHSRTVFKLWQWRTSGDGMIDPDWFAKKLARLDIVEGDIDQLASRIAAVRTLCFIAQRGDWIADAAGWTQQTQALETRLSDALHAALAQRFVDRRLALLIRDAGQRGAALPVAVGADGTVAVDGEAIGTLKGFQFKVDAKARASDHRLLLAAAEKHLRAEMARRAASLAEGDDSTLALVSVAGEAPRIAWHGDVVATLAKGPTLVQPAILIEPALRRLEVPQVQAIVERLQRFVAAQLARHAAPLAAMGEAAGDLFTPPRVRALLAALVDGGGFVAREAVDGQLVAMSPDERPLLRKIGLTIGSLDLFHPLLLKPEAVRWRAALLAAQQGGRLPVLPPHGAVWQKDGPVVGLGIAGFRRCGEGWLRIDMAERLARQAHAARLQADAKPAAPIAGGDEHDEDHGGHEVAATPPPAGFAIDPALATSLGLDAGARRGLLQAFGFRSVGEPELDRWRWSGHRGRDKKPRHKQGKKQGARPGQRAPQRGRPDAPAPNGVAVAGPGKPRKDHKDKRRKPGKQGAAPPPPRQDRPERSDRTPRRGPSPNSPFAGLAALLADARKDG